MIALFKRLDLFVRGLLKSSKARVAAHGARTAALRRIRIVVGDITALNVDAVVNAANSTLLGGGGVDGAIHRAAGPDLLEHCRTLGGCETGDVKHTPGFKLKARHILHAVGPDTRVIEDPAEQNRLLAAVYRKAMTMARALGLRSIAFPAISCGIYGFSPERAAQIAIRVIAEELESAPSIEVVKLVAFDDKMARVLDWEHVCQSGAADNPLTSMKPVMA